MADLDSHEMTVHYTTDDDGIWLWCPDCEYSEPMGFDPTASAVKRAGARHLEATR